MIICKQMVLKSLIPGQFYLFAFKSKERYIYVEDEVLET